MTHFCTGVAPTPNKNFDYVPYEILSTERKKLSRLYTFIWCYVGKTISINHGSRYAMGLFSRSRPPLDLFAHENYTLGRFMNDGIRAGSNRMNIGYNAVQQGIIGRESLRTIGEENEFPLLKRYAVYYIPISILSPYEPYDQVEECGLGITASLDNTRDDYLTMIRGTAHDMMITLQFNNIATVYYERSGKGILSIDNMTSTPGRNLAIYYNDELSKVPETPPISTHYEPAENSIDSLPANEEFWDTVQNHHTIANQPLEMTCNGRTVEVIVSTDAFNQPMINAYGVVSYFTTPQKMIAELSRQVTNGAVETPHDIIGENVNLKKPIQKAQRMVQTNSNIMILGESGTDKDVFAQAIYNTSARHEKPSIALNCGALPRDLVESGLFSYETKAFTNARKNGNIGKFELASGGTIFLDEIGEMPLKLQARLFRVTETKQLMRLGGSKNIRVDVCITVATNVNIDDMIVQKLFRAGLHYRFSTMKLYLMSLRERRDDIVPPAEHFIRSISRRIDKPNIMRFSENVRELLQQMDWFGNVHELQNLIGCVTQSYPGDITLPEYILDNVSERYYPKNVLKNISPVSALREAFLKEDTAAAVPWSIGAPPIPLPKAALNIPSDTEVPLDSSNPWYPKSRKRKVITKEDIYEALAACNNNRTAASQYLGISRRIFY